MSNRRAALQERVQALSASEREALARAVAAGGRQAAHQLVAYLVASAPPPTPDELDGFLRNRLPEYMVPSRYVLLERLPRTPAGKLDRRAALAAVGTELGGRATGLVPPRTEREARLAEIWRDVLGLDEISVHDDFFEVGGDSLLSIRVIARAGRAGIEIRPEDFFDGPTVARLAGLTARPSTAEQDAVVGDAPLTPIQHWFFERITAERDHWNQAVLLDVPAPLEPKAVREAVAALVAHHDALRLRFVRANGGWRQEFLPAPEAHAIRSVDLSGTSGEERLDRVRREADAEHQGLDLGEGRLFRVVLFETGEGVGKILLVAHHLLVDGVSWGILLEDLSTLIAQSAAGSALRLPRKTASARAWAEALERRAGELTREDAVATWIDSSVPVAWTRFPALGPEGTIENQVGRATTHIVALDHDETAAILERATGDATVQELLLAALSLAWHEWTGHDGLQLDVEGHGRDALGERLDASRTVGWFTTVFPLTLTLPEPNVEGALRTARSALRRLPMRGSEHGLFRYLHPDSELRRELEERPRSELLFNYFGPVDDLLPPDAPFKLVPGEEGMERSPGCPRAYAVEINARIQSRALRLQIEYVPDLHGTETMQRFAAALRRALVAVSRSALPPAESRFELSGLDRKGLDQVARLLGELDAES